MADRERRILLIAGLLTRELPPGETMHYKKCQWPDQFGATCDCAMKFSTLIVETLEANGLKS